MELVDKLLLLFQYLFLGIFQGFTEPIPISSSGHLVILRELFNLNAGGLMFEVFVNFGSLIAVLLVYRKDLIRLINNGWGFLFQKQRDKEASRDFRFIVYLIIGTVPAAVLGIVFGDWIEQTFGDMAKLVGLTLIVTGVALWVIRNLKGSKGDGDLTVWDALIIGLAQAVALVPGISRSGATIVAAMLIGTRKATALRFSFLLYIPVSLGTVLLNIDEFIDNGVFSTMLIPYLLAFIGSILASYFALKWFINVMKEGNLKYFAFYCFIVGTLVFLLL